MRLRALLPAALLVAGCVDLGEHIDEVPFDPDAWNNRPEVGEEDVVVHMRGQRFVEDPVTVVAGGSVTWVNEDTTFHIIAAGKPNDPGDWIGPAVNFGESWTHTFDEPGEYIYYCDNHERVMRDAVVVVVP